MAIYHIFTRAADRKYDHVYARSFAKDLEAIAFALALLVSHPFAEVWKSDTLVGEVSREEQRPPSMS
jgi:hypothetical protein